MTERKMWKTGRIWIILLLVMLLTGCTELPVQPSETGQVLPESIGHPYLCVNGEVISLETDGTSSWVAEQLQLSKGDSITLYWDDSLKAAPFTGEGILDSEGNVITDTSDATLRLSLKGDWFSVRIEDREYQGMAVRINGELYPMVPGNSAGSFLYGYGLLNIGDRLSLEDTAGDLRFPWADPAENSGYCLEENWEIRITEQGRYLIQCDGTGSLVPVFSPAGGVSMEVVLSGGKADRIPMTETAIPENSVLYPKLAPLTAPEGTVNGEDIRTWLEAKGMTRFSTAVYLNGGTLLRLESGDGTLHIGTDRLLPSAGVQRETGGIRILREGTYYVEYLPFCGSLRLLWVSGGNLRQAARELDSEIAATPWGLEHCFQERLCRLYERYTQLQPHLGSMLQAEEKLTAMYDRLIAQESNPVIYYLNTPKTNNVYPSKEALFEGFYTDFYYYIAAFYGTEKLSQWKIHSPGEFLAFAADENAGDYEEFRAIGFVAGEYLLESRKNRPLEVQTDSGFFGFCRENGIYEEILPFFIRFFAYWRLDEGAANRNNCWADIFAEAWAPTVDITKFFHYNENTSYVKSQRVLDCFVNPAGVVYGLEDGPLPQVRLRGYVFGGWYTDPECTGEPVTALPEEEGPVRLYAKWLPDPEQQNRDRAELVDIAIYNLTTAAASRNETTIGYAAAMYDALPEEAKALVTRADILQDYRKWLS